MDDVDLAASRFRDDSELAALDRADGAWTPISPLFTELLAVALRAARLTDGDVDPTVGASLSGLGYDRDVEEIHADGLVLAVPAPGWRAIELDEEACRVRVAPGVALDLGATAKAWTADTAAAAVTAATGSGCLVSIGGDIAVAGRRSARRLADPGRGRHGRPATPRRRARPPSSPSATAGWPPPRPCGRRWQRAGLLAAPPRRPAHRPAAGSGLAHRLRRRGHLRRRERAEHRGRRPRQPRLAAAPRGPAARPAGDRGRAGAHRRRLARGAGGHDSHRIHTGYQRRRPAHECP